MPARRAATLTVGATVVAARTASRGALVVAAVVLAVDGAAADPARSPENAAKAGACCVREAAIAVAAPGLVPVLASRG